MFILMADDDREDRLLMSYALKDAQITYHVEFAINGKELINQLKAKTQKGSPMPDIILLDLNMPVKDGKSALKEIKSDPELAKLRILIFSTSASETDIAYCMNAGADQYIQKPSDFGALVTLVKDLNMELADKIT